MRALMPILTLLATGAALAGCAAVPPAGPRVAVMPGPSKTLEQFQADDATCRQYAMQQTGYASPAAIQQNSTATGAAVGTLAGAAAGAAIGAATGNPAAGAAIGAGSGLVVGTAAGASNGYASSQDAQQAYDVAYQQCMVASGNKLPTPAPVVNAPAVYGYPAPYYYPGPAYYAAPPPVVYFDGYWGPGPHHWH